MRKLLIAAFVLWALIGSVANAAGQANPWTSTAQFTTDAWDTSHAGTPLPAVVIASWGHSFHIDFASDPTCSQIVDNTNYFWPYNKTPDTVHKMWVGNNHTNTTYSCASGNLVVTQSFSGTWGTFLGSFASYNYSGFSQGYGYMETAVGLPTPPANFYPWIASVWRISQFVVGLVNPQVWPFREIDDETYIRNNSTPTTYSDHDWVSTYPTSVMPTANSQVQVDVTSPSPFGVGTHTHGILCIPAYCAMYLDRVETARRSNLHLNADMARAATMNFWVDTPLWSSDTSKTYTVTFVQGDAYAPPAGYTYPGF